MPIRSRSRASRTGRISNRLSLAALLASALALPAVAGPPGAPAPARPNFLLIVADDLGYSDLGVHGGEISTPNIDALAGRSLRLANMHTAPACSPTRAMLLTGLDNHEAGIGSMAEAIAPNQRGRRGYEGYLRDDTATLPEILAAAGYRTAFAGKWHLGLTPEQDPSRRGFQHSFALLQAAHNHFGLDLSTDPAKGPTYRKDGRVVSRLPADFYSSDSFADKLIAQLAESRAGTGHGTPFFAYLAFSAPHWPLHAPAETLARYRGRYDAGYEAIRSDRLRRQAELGLAPPGAPARPIELAPRWDRLTAADRDLSARRMEAYAAMVTRLDENVGRVLDALERSGELRNTYVLFLSDNGSDAQALGGPPASPRAARHAAADNRPENIGAPTSYESKGLGWGEAGSAPLWRVKGFQSEGGTRVAAFLAGPGIASRRDDSFVSVMDVLPTFLDLAGIAPVGTRFAGRAVQPARGRSWAARLNGGKGPLRGTRRPVAAEFLGERAVWQGEWKLLDIGDGQWRLYNLARDPGETRDLAASTPRRKARLAAAWEGYARDVGVVLPEPRPSIVASLGGDGP